MATTKIYVKFDTFFSPPEICGKISQIYLTMKTAVEFFSMKLAVKIFFNTISSGGGQIGRSNFFQ